MKKLLQKDLVKKSLKDLVKMRNKVREELYDLKLKNALRSLTQTHLIRLARRNIARINGVISEKASPKAA